MKILVLSNNYPPHYYGGYELTCADVVDRFRAAGHEVVVLTADVRVPGVADVSQPHVRRQLRATWDWEANRSTVSRSPLRRLLIERDNLRRFREAVADLQPDVLSVWHIAAISLSLLTEAETLRLPMVVTVANDWLSHAPLLDGWHRMWSRWPLRPPRAFAGVPTALPAFGNAVVNFVSAHTRERATECGVWRFPDAPLVPPGIDLDDFPIRRAEKSPWGWRLLYVGRIDPTKGVETLLHAFSRLPDQATLRILGGGDVPYLGHLRRVADSLGIAGRLEFDVVPRSQLAAEYRAADAVIFPSEWDEPFGLVPLEAMACGTAVIASIRGGSAEFLADRVNCLAFPAGDAASLAGAVRELAADDSLGDRLRAKGTETASEFTIDRYAERLLALHREALAKSAG